jgi:glycosyltransferase involved in cell wall biosynthesis
VKKKILFMLINMNIGGTEKALLNLIAELSKEEIEITILMLEEYGGFLAFIPARVNIDYVKGYGNIKRLLNDPLHIVALDLLKRFRVIEALTILFLYFFSKLMRDRSTFFAYLLHNYPVTEHEYDIAVAFAGPMDFISYFVAKKIKAKKKIQWIHFDITKVGFNLQFAMKIYAIFDKIFVVSSEGRNKLISKIPKLKDRIDVFNNIVSSKEILNQTRIGSGFTDKYDGIRILTVGRLAHEKGQDLAIRVLARLIDDGYQVKWYCVGDGKSKEIYKSLVAEYNLQDNFIFLGSSPNPYSYIEQCDIYVQPSRYEGFCITLIEARCLKKPIVTTDVNGAKEQIKSGETGLIVNINEYEIYNAVKNLMDDQDLRKKLSSNLANENIDHQRELDKLLAILT